MKFSTRTEVNTPVEDAFAAFADFDTFARLAEARGARMERLPGEVFAWRARFEWNGAAREVKGDIVRFEPPRGYAAAMIAGGLEGDLEVEVTPLSAGRSQVRVAMEWRPVTMSARVLLKSLKLVKGRLDARFAARVDEYAARIGTRS
jgi:hypothetical protein